MSRISVIIVSWNARAHLSECLRSVRDTSHDLDIDVTVVDNASTDGSPEMVKHDYPSVNLVQLQTNAGFAKANNVGMQSAEGDYYVLLNSDVVVHPGCIAALAAVLETDSLAGLVGPAITDRDGILQVTARRLPSVWGEFCRSLGLDRWAEFNCERSRCPQEKTTEHVEALSGCFWVARREAVQQVGGLDERFFFYAEDLDWCKRFREAPWKVLYVPAATATHLGGGSTRNAPLRYSIELLRADLAYWMKHYGRLGLCYYFSLSVLHHACRIVLRGFTHLVRRDARGEHSFKCLRSFICLRWLVTGKEG